MARTPPAKEPRPSLLSLPLVLPPAGPRLTGFEDLRNLAARRALVPPTRSGGTPPVPVMATAHQGFRIKS